MLRGEHSAILSTLLSNQFPLRPLFGLILSGTLRQKKIIICPREGVDGTSDAQLD